MEITQNVAVVLEPTDVGCYARLNPPAAHVC